MVLTYICLLTEFLFYFLINIVQIDFIFNLFRALWAMTLSSSEALMSLVIDMLLLPVECRVKVWIETFIDFIIDIEGFLFSLAIPSTLFIAQCLVLS